MTNSEDPLDFCVSQKRARLSETEISQLLQKAIRQYEECMRLADLDDISKVGEVRQPRYAWDNPIGLVISGRENA